MMMVMMIMIVAATGALLAMLVMVMMAAVLMVVLILIMVMMVVMFVLVLVVVVVAAFVVMMVLMLVIIMVVMVVAALVIVIVMMMVVMLVVMVALIIVIIVVMSAYRADPLVLEQFLCKAVLDLHCLKDLLAVDVIPRSGYDGSMLVELADHRKSLSELVLGELLGTAEYDGLCSFYLVLVELAEVLHIHLDLGRVNYGCVGVEYEIVALNVHDSLEHVRQLADAGRLDKDTIRVELLKHLRQSLAEITYQRAANAALVHFCYLYAGVLHEAAVNADLAELILDKHQLLTGVSLL